MKQYLTFVIAAAIFIIVAAIFLSHMATGASYSTEATIIPLLDDGQYQVDVSLSRLVEKHGRQVEKVIARPRISAGVGCPASFYQNLQNKDNVTVDVSWPYPKESGLAYCTVVLKHGDTVLSESKLQLKITGPGRVPLVLSPQTVDPKSVCVETDKSRSITYVLLEFSGKTEKEAKAMAIENLGNKVQVQDTAGRIVENGVITGTYKEVGLALPYDRQDEAKRVASVLEGTE